MNLQQNKKNAIEFYNMAYQGNPAKAVELFDLIKEKLFDNIKVNYNFEDEIDNKAELKQIDADLLNEKYKSKIIS